MDIIKVIISFIDNFKSINVANIIAFVETIVLAILK
jgi:hypothetical protein